MSIHGMSARPETLLFLAWATRTGLRERLIEVHHERRERREDAGAPERVLRAAIKDNQAPVFGFDSVYGPVYEALFTHRLGRVEFQLIDWALRGSSAVYLTEDSESDAAGEKAEVGTPSNEETALIWEVIAQSERLAGRLKRLSDDWCGNVIRGARLLQLQFIMHVPVRTVECPFLIHEYLLMSLERVNWEELATWLLDLPYAPQSAPMDEHRESDDQVLCVATLLELIQAARRSVEEYMLESKLSDHIRGLCVQLVEECDHAHEGLGRLWEEGGTAFACEPLM